MKRMLLILSWMLVTADLFAQVDPVPMTIPLKVVDGHLLVGGYVLNCDNAPTDFHLEISFQIPETIRFNRVMARWMVGAVEDKPDKYIRDRLIPRDFDVRLGDITFKVPGREMIVWEEPARMFMHNDLTERYAKELDRRKVVGTLGLGFLKDYRVEIDLPKGEMRLSQPDIRRPVAGDVVRSFDEKNGKLAIAFQYENGKPGRLLLASDKYDTYIDQGFARSLGKPAGDIGPVLLSAAGESRIDLSQHMALRPGDLSADKKLVDTEAVLLSGVKLLESFALEIDWSASKLGLTRREPPNFPQMDYEFFKAEASGDPKEIFEFLRNHSQYARRAEVAGVLMNMLLANSAAADTDIKEAVKWVVSTTDPEWRLTDMEAYLNKVMRVYPDRGELLEHVANEALKHARNAVENGPIYNIHLALGKHYLKGQHYDEAWRHLLSASVMLSEIPAAAVEIHTALGQVYESQGRWFRAYAAYKKVLRTMGGERKPEDMPTEKELAAADERAKQGWARYLDTLASLQRVRQHLSKKDLETLDI